MSEIQPHDENNSSKTGGKVALITGITGQDGSYLAELLLEKGYTVSQSKSIEENEKICLVFVRFRFVIVFVYIVLSDNGTKIESACTSVITQRSIMYTKTIKPLSKATDEEMPKFWTGFSACLLLVADIKLSRRKISTVVRAEASQRVA